METANQLRNAAKICLLYLLLLLCAALFFYKERMLFVDAPWVVFNIINQKTLFIQEHRYGSFITQIFPLIGVWLHLKLNTILILYSLSFNLFYLTVGFMLYRIKAYKLLILLSFYYSLLLSDSFYWTNNELQQGVAWMFLLFGFLFYAERKEYTAILKYTIFLGLAFLALFTHPIVLLICGFMWVFFLLTPSEKVFRKRSIIGYSVILIIVTAIKFYMSQRGWYDGGKIEQITSINKNVFFAALDSKALKIITENLLTNYWIASLIGLLGFIYLLLTKRILLSFIVLISAIVYVFLMCVINYGEPSFFYLESELMPLSIMLSIVFVWHLIEKIKGKQLIIILVIIFSVRAGYILFSSQYFSQRLVLLQSDLDWVEDKGLKKVIIRRSGDNTLRQQAYKMYWALPIETLLLGNLDSKKKNITIIYLPPEQLTKFQPIGNSDFLCAFYKIPYSSLNKEYFDASTPYNYTILNDWMVK